MRVSKKIISCCAVAAILLTSFVSAKSGQKGDTSVTNTLDLPDSSLFEINSNRHTQTDTQLEQVVNLLSTDGFEKKMENNRFEIWFRPKTAGIRIVDRSNGYIWGGLTADKVDGMNEKWCAMANSLCTMEYFNDVYAEKRISISDSSAQTQFVFEEDSMKCSVTFRQLKISFSFNMTLLDDGLRIAMDEGSLSESGDCFIKSLYFLPFLGCSREDAVDGYLFVPDGPGALIRFAKSSNYVGGFEGKVYGLDMGIDTLTEACDLQANRTNDYLVDAPQVTMPVFGVVHGARSNAVLGVIEQGEQYASIVASVAGALTDYYWATARFDYRQLYVHSTSSNGQGVYTAQEKPADMTPAIRYYFLSGDKADYSGMAVTYREYLQGKKILNEERLDENIPCRLNVVGAEIKKGIIFNRTAAFTNTTQAKKFAEELGENGISNLTMVYEGWQRGGINGSKFGSTAFNSGTGSRSQVEALRDYVRGNGGRFYLQCNPATANKDRINLKTDVSVTISNTLAKFIRANTKIMYYESYLAKPSGVIDAVDHYISKLDGFSLSFQQIGSRLYSDYTRSENITRSETQQAFTTELEKCKNDVAFFQANQYLWPYMTEYFDIPTTNSQYLYETDTVPFLQIVLKGSVDYYAPYANQGFYAQTNILKMMEYGCYPSFIVTDSDNYSLTGTPLADYFSLNFDDWSGTIENVYKTLNDALKQTEGQYIIEHRMLESGVARVTYSGGTIIYINYNTEPYSDGNVTVPSQGYCIERR